MELTKKIPTTDKNQENNHLLRMLDRGIDDMEAGRELPLEDAFRKITELRDARRNKIILTWEAIYDVTDIADYIEEEFGQQRADRFQSDLKEQMQNLGQFSTAFPRTQILYRGYSIHKRSFPPSIIFYIIMEETKEIHILRVLRHEQDWENILLQRSTYTYPE